MCVGGGGGGGAKWRICVCVGGGGGDAGGWPVGSDWQVQLTQRNTM